VSVSQQSAPAQQLPLVVEDVTASWLTSALAQRYPGVEVTSARHETILHGTATKIRIRARYNSLGREAGLPETFIVKGGFSAHREMMAYIYELEMRFYRDVASRLTVRLPKCLYAGGSTAAGQAIVILEDLDVRGASFCRVERPLSYEQALLHLNAQAELHARWWNSDEFSTGGSLDWVEPLDPLPEGEAGTYQRGQLKPDVYAKFMSLPRGVAVARMFHDRDRMERAMERLRQIDAAGPNCLLHGDFHLGNLYFDADGAAGVLDWQSTRRGPWAHDFTYFMVSALDMAERREWEKPLLRHYLEQLTRHGAPAPRFDDAWDAYITQIAYGLYYWLVNPVEFQTEANNCAVAPRFALAALDHDTFGRLGV
jgi:Phosphotransferase enzyme family